MLGNMRKQGGEDLKHLMFLATRGRRPQCSHNVRDGRVVIDGQMSSLGKEVLWMQSDELIGRVNKAIRSELGTNIYCYPLQIEHAIKVPTSKMRGRFIPWELKKC